ncbi:MAG: hypothetical protein L0206_20205, partial [Actinobacteria bacterium]|nr:hypothetical protein [Actinomycetota bacterium]
MATSTFVLPEVELLKRVFAAERKLLVLVASLPPLIPGVTEKYDLARFAYEDATHAEALRQRIAQMRSGGRREPRLDPALDAVFEAALRGPTNAAIVLGIFGVLKRDVVRTYDAYLAGTHPVGDLPSRVLIQSALAQDTEQIAAGTALADRLGVTDPDREWCAWLRARLLAAGGVDGELKGPPVEDADRPETRPFAYPLLPEWGDHPLRLRLVGDDPASDLLPFCWDGDLRVARVGMYEWLFQEADVLDYLPPMFHPTQGMPFEFQFDLARHLWD